jgi:uncharacterized ubiquitin-like protein YukD
MEMGRQKNMSDLAIIFLKYIHETYQLRIPDHKSGCKNFTCLVATSERLHHNGKSAIQAHNREQSGMIILHVKADKQRVGMARE